MRRVRGWQGLQDLRDLGVEVGEGTWVASRIYVDPAFAWAVTIGPGSVISHEVVIIAHDAASKAATGLTEVLPVKVGANVYVGARAMLMPGADIGDNCIIGAGALVRGPIPRDTVAVGVPARPIESVASYAARQSSAVARSPRLLRGGNALTRADMEKGRRMLAEHGRLYCP